jgi:hypothetical protein
MRPSTVDNTSPTVRMAGLEPARHLRRQSLKLLRLPNYATSAFWSAKNRKTSWGFPRTAVSATSTTLFLRTVSGFAPERPFGQQFLQCSPTNIRPVPRGGVEPPRSCERQILSLLRLPVPPSRHISDLHVKHKVRCFFQQFHADVHH